MADNDDDDGLTFFNPQIVKKSRESSRGPEAFARRLTSALQRLQLNSVLQWLKDQLGQWEGWVNQTVVFTPFFCGAHADQWLVKGPTKPLEKVGDSDCSFTLSRSG